VRSPSPFDADDAFGGFDSVVLGNLLHKNEVMRSVTNVTNISTGLSQVALKKVVRLGSSDALAEDSQASPDDWCGFRNERSLRGFYWEISILAEVSSVNLTRGAGNHLSHYPSMTVDFAGCTNYQETFGSDTDIRDVLSLVCDK